MTTIHIATHETLYRVGMDANNETSLHFYDKDGKKVQLVFKDPLQLRKFADKVHTALDSFSDNRLNSVALIKHKSN